MTLINVSSLSIFLLIFIELSLLTLIRASYLDYFSMTLLKVPSLVYVNNNT